ncbi:MAG: sulfite exporter TauE/SafE family protein [Sulfobacillus thermotolerans]|uniref:Probable membrane transporter protein n=1 Tax=Sulfobacillus thermotolerans TaxID=338644 RepID=A0ABM6RT12_9FIRM|nr:hypothetical protein BXT84_11190 [Sulfobacillus thermotolerans]MCY0907533.1 sulfite exporter TauE/SafE family protein [Sulfobacillus thermotolerans]
MFEQWLLLSVVGILTGALTGFSGGSAFVIVVPFLTQVWHTPVRMAVGSSLAVDVLTSIVVAVGYARNRAVDLGNAWPLLGAAILGPQLGAMLSHVLPTWWLTAIFVVALLFMGINFLQHGWRNIPLMPEPGAQGKIERPTRRGGQALGVLAAGLAVGTVTGLIGASGGVLYLLVLIYGLGMPLRTAVGTAIVIMAVSATSGVGAYVWRSEIAWGPAVLLGGVSMISGYTMARFVQKVPERVQAGIMGGILIVAALWMAPKIF